MRAGHFFLALGLAALAAAGANCTNLAVYPFGGYAYNPTNDCLEAPGALDVIEGMQPAPCPVLRCWVDPDGTAVITNEACAAPPDYKNETTATTGLCPKALAVYATAGHGQCPAGLGGGGAGSL
jgi:hypothetical protein